MRRWTRNALKDRRDNETKSENKSIKTGAHTHTPQLKMNWWLVCGAARRHENVQRQKEAKEKRCVVIHTL